MLTKRGAKLLDFGLAKLRPPVNAAAERSSSASTNGAPLTSEGTIVGTLQYMAPEQLEGREVDARTDIFAFGAVMYEMATRTRPFSGSSQASVMAAILEHTPPPIYSHQPLSPRALNDIVQRCLGKDPQDRWQTASDLTFALNKLRQDVCDPSSPPGMSAAPAPRGWWKASLITVASAVLVVMTYLAWTRASP